MFISRFFDAPHLASLEANIRHLESCIEQQENLIATETKKYQKELEAMELKLTTAERKWKEASEKISQLAINMKDAATILSENNKKITTATQIITLRKMELQINRPGVDINNGSGEIWWRSLEDAKNMQTKAVSENEALISSLTQQNTILTGLNKTREMEIKTFKTALTHLSENIGELKATITIYKKEWEKRSASLSQKLLDLKTEHVKHCIDFNLEKSKNEISIEKAAAISSSCMLLGGCGLLLAMVFIIINNKEDKEFAFKLSMLSIILLGIGSYTGGHIFGKIVKSTGNRFNMFFNHLEHNTDQITETIAQSGEAAKGVFRDARSVLRTTDHAIGDLTHTTNQAISASQEEHRKTLSAIREDSNVLFSTIKQVIRDRMVKPEVNVKFCNIV